VRFAGFHVSLPVFKRHSQRILPQSGMDGPRIERVFGQPYVSASGPGTDKLRKEKETPLPIPISVSSGSQGTETDFSSFSATDLSMVKPFDTTSGRDSSSLFCD